MEDIKNNLSIINDPFDYEPENFGVITNAFVEWKRKESSLNQNDGFAIGFKRLDDGKFSYSVHLFKTEGNTFTIPRGKKQGLPTFIGAEIMQVAYTGNNGSLKGLLVDDIIYDPSNNRASWKRAPEENPSRSDDLYSSQIQWISYSNIPVVGESKFEGAYDEDGMTRSIVDMLHQEFPKTRGKRTEPQVACDGNPYFLYINTINNDEKARYCYTFDNFTGFDHTFHNVNVYSNRGTNWNEWELEEKLPSLKFGSVVLPRDPKEKPLDPQDTIIYTNNSLSYKDTQLANYESKKYIRHPRDVYKGYNCDGDPWPPPGELFPPTPGDTNLPTGHKYYIKCIEGSVEMCWTFDGFQERDGHWNITANNKRILKYIKDAGCWHFFTSLGAAEEIDSKYTLKDVVTNNKEVYDYLSKTGKFQGKIKYNDKPVDISPYFWQSSRNLYFASWTTKEKSPKPQDQTWYLALFDFADGTTIKKPDETTTPIIGHFENGKIYKLEAPWTSYQQWKLEGTYTKYNFDKQPTYHNFQSNHRVLYGWLDRHGRTSGNHSKFISPCTNPLPDGSLPPGVIGPPRPPKPKPPGAGGNDPFGPPAPQPPDPSASIEESQITQCPGGFDLIGTRVNQRLNGLYFYYLEESLFNTAGDKDNTSILGTTAAICNVAYIPFLNISNTDLCKAEFDVKRYGEFEGKGTPWVFRIKSFLPREMKIASWNVYPTNVTRGIKPGTPWKYTMESRLLDYPYRRCVFFSNVFDAYDVIPHLHYQSSGSLTMDLKVCCAVTPGGNFYAYVDNYKNDKTGFIERQFSNASMDIPNTSSAYSNYMSTQKAQASNSLFNTAINTFASAVPVIAGVGMTVASGGSLSSVGLPLAAAGIGAAVSTGGAISQSMAQRKDLITTPKSLSSMGGDIIARLGNSTKATVLSCDMVITDMYKDNIARFFQMYGTKQNRVIDVQNNINSRYYYNYIKTVGCNVSGNGVPKKHIATIKSIMDKGTTLWHLDRDGVNFGEYCVYDNCEM